MTINIGSVANDRVALKFKTTAALTGVSVDPSPLIVIAEAPDGTETTYTYGVDDEINRVETGIYTLAIRVTSAGVWKFSVEAGNSESDYEGSYQFTQYVTPSLI